MRKKISVLLLAAGMVLAAAMPSQAIDFKVKGQWQVGFQYSNVFPSVDDDMHVSAGPNSRDKFNAMQLVRLHLDAVASENLSGSVELELAGNNGSAEWGKASNGAALGADGTNVKVRFAYLDWVIPNTKIKTRMGLQMIMMPGIIDSYGVSPVFGKEMAGVTVNAPILEGDVKMNASLFWARPYNDNYEGDGRNNAGYLDNLDVFGLSLPIMGDGWKLTPYGMYAMIGKYSMTNVGGGKLTNTTYDKGIFAPRTGLLPVLGGGGTKGLQYFAAAFGENGVNQAKQAYLRGLDRAYGDGFWFGLPISVDITDALRVGLEGVYGSVNMGSIKNYQNFAEGKGKTFELRRAGWYVGGRVDYKMDWGTPGLIAWYGSGDDSNPYNGSERLPQFNTPWAVTSLAGGDNLMDDMSWKVLGHNPGGQAAIVAQIDKMSFVEDLTHTLRAAYFHGTNSPKMVRKTGMGWPIAADGASAYLTTLDHAWEFSLKNRYKIYDNLRFDLGAAYVRMELDKSVWRHAASKHGKDHYRFNAVFTYSF